MPSWGPTSSTGGNGMSPPTKFSGSRLEQDENTVMPYRLSPRGSGEGGEKSTRGCLVPARSPAGSGTGLPRPVWAEGQASHAGAVRVSGICARSPRSKTTQGLTHSLVSPWGRSLPRLRAGPLSLRSALHHCSRILKFLASVSTDGRVG